MDYRKYFFSSVGVIIVLVFFILKGCGSQDKKVDELSSMLAAAQSKEKHYITKSGEDSTEKLLLYGDVETLKKLNITGNAEIDRLKQMVNKLTISATVFGTTTSGTATGSTTVIVPSIPSKADTGLTPDFLARVKSLSCKLKLDSACLPTYDIATDTTIIGGKLRDTTSKWIRVNGYVDRKGFNLKYVVFNDFEISQQFKEEGSWLRPKKVPYVTIVNKNPYTKTTKTQSFAIKPPAQDKITIGLGATMGYDLFNRAPGWTVGLTLNYRLIGF